MYDYFAGNVLAKGVIGTGLDVIAYLNRVIVGERRDLWVIRLRG